jgi:hypothetical protein
MNNSFKDKNILLICPSFFNYEKEIKNTLEDLGASVEFFDERPKNSFLTKVIIRSGLNVLVKKNIDTHYQALFNKVSTLVFDTILVINPEVIDKPKVQYLKSLHPKARFILYMWDSFENKEKSYDLVHFFDKKVTFDKQDSMRYGMQFLPLFYINAYSKIPMKKAYKYDICFIGTAHSDRYKIVKAVENITNQYNLKVFPYFYLPSAVMFWIRKLFLPKYKYGDIGEFSFLSLTHNKIANIFENSKVILDINHPLQSGLTSRSLEALGAKRKLITTNQNIIHYDFYNNQNVYLLDRNNPKVERDFFTSDFKQLDDSIYDKYSLRSWLMNLFDCENK